MTDNGRGQSGRTGAFRGVIVAVFIGLSGVCGGAPGAAQAQTFQFSNIVVTGNQRVDAATILAYAGIERGTAVSAGRLNDAYQSIVDSGLFEIVEMVPRGGTLEIRVREFPTINQISFEGNRRINDEDLAELIRSQSRRVYSPSIAEADAAAIVGAYEAAGRLSATVTPKIIRRSENRVDLVFEIVEGAVIEVERISFVGNRTFSDGRLRRALASKQAGLLRQFIRADTFLADRIEFDRQALSDFYLSRGFIDFQVLSVTPELTRNRDAYLLTFNIREGQRFRFGRITTVSELAEIDPAEFGAVSRIRSGQVYSPVDVDSTIARMERLALEKGLNFVRVEPRVSRNDRDQTLDLEFAVVRGPRIFVERIDIEGNATTLDEVIRREFRTVEGDPFNPREISAAAERIRALGFFETAEVTAREGSRPDQQIIDVNVEEQPTGSLSFGLSYSATDGAGAAVAFTERNFLGRGQLLSFRIDAGTDTGTSRFVFAEPAALGRDVTFRLSALYAQSDQAYDAKYDTRNVFLSPALQFPLSENGRLEVRYTIGQNTLENYRGDSAVLEAEEEGALSYSEIGYTYRYDNRLTGLDPDAGWFLSFGQDFAGLGGDMTFVETTALVGAEWMVWNEEVTLRAELEGGMLNFLDGQSSRVSDRYFMNGKIRGFEANGIGPRDLDSTDEEALGGNMFVVARLEAQFPIGLPEEYGITGGLFTDVGAPWGLDNPLDVDDGFNVRAVVGVSLFWDTPVGPLRFNFSDAVVKEDYDNEQNFEFTISTQF